jgi:hypothetical protein
MLFLFRMAGLLSAVAGKALSLQFHHVNHFERMQVRACNSIVHEVRSLDKEKRPCTGCYSACIHCINISLKCRMLEVIRQASCPNRCASNRNKGC